MLDVKNSRIGRYKLLEVNHKRYLIDTLNTKPNFLCFMFSPKEVVFSISEIDRKDTSLDKEEIKFKFGPILGVLVTLPLTRLIYDFGKTLFINNSIDEQILFKIILFILSILIPIFTFITVSKIDKNKLETKIEKVTFNEQLVINAKSQKKHQISFLLILVLIIGIIYFKTQNGTEAVLLLLSAMVTFGCLIGTRYALQSNDKGTEYHISKKAK